MKLIILGSGTFVPEIERGSSSLLIESGENSIAIDFGRGAIDRILKSKTKLEAISHIFISHFHTDHSSELIPFLGYLIDHPKKSELKEKYFILGPRGTNKKVNELLRIFHLSEKKNVSRIVIKDLSDGENVSVGKLNICALKSLHEEGLNSLSFKVSEGKKVLFYSGDTAFNKRLVRNVSGSDAAILEATAPKDWNIKSHLNGEEAGIVAREADVRKLILTHVASFYTNQAVKDAKKEYKREVILSKDLMEIKI